MHDVTGREVRTLFEGGADANTMTSVQVDADGLPSGIYLIRLEGETFFANQTITLVK